MKSIATIALLFAGTVHAGEPRQVPVMYAPCQGPACQAPAVQLPTPWPAVRQDAGDSRGGSQAADAPATIVLAVGQCPGGVCPTQPGMQWVQQGQTVRYVPQMATQIAPPVMASASCGVQASSVAYERPRLFARLFYPDRPRLFGRLFTGKLFGGCCK